MSVSDRPRASPDALLALASREGRGRLRIFLGAAPGVGKTFAMLQAAQAARATGVDVAVGLAETHGRAETEALLAGLEVLPRRLVPYQGRLLPELDLDAALARRPALLLVDEYAHTNVPGSRHPKRWQDVEELIAAGIDVWTTLNVQHLESLNDVVQRITRVRVRETVPDSVFEEADDVVLVDLPPGELLKRLAEGRVYVQDTAARAVENFFRINNLVALRELALRRAAERIDSDLRERMQGGAIEGPWAAGERILVCVGAEPTAPAVVRHAKRLADLIGAPLVAVTIERSGSRPDAALRARIDATLRLAESLGAETRSLTANDLVGELLRFAKYENVTQIVVGRSRAGLLSELLGRSLPQQLVRAADDIAIHVVTPPLTRRFGIARSTTDFGVRAAGSAWGYAWSLLAVMLAALVGRALILVVPLPNISMLFLLAVLFAAIRFGFVTAAFASALSFFTYNFFFIEPLYTFTVAQPYELLALFVFLGAAVTTSALAGRARAQAQAALGRARINRRLFEFTRTLSRRAAPADIAESAVAQLYGDLGQPVVLLLEDAGELAIAASWPPEDQLDTAALSAARWAHDRNEPAGSGTGTLPAVPWLFLPLMSGERVQGVLGIAREDQPLDSEALALAQSVADLTAAALDRAQLAREFDAARLAAESERVRNTLLASISHDFRTPLASIMGAATGLRDYGARLAEPARLDLLDQIREEAENLDGMVRNLLAITRLEAGAMELREDWVDLGETFDRAIANARRRGAPQALAAQVASDVPLVRADPTLLDQALGNLVGNAVRYAGPEARIALSARRENGRVVIAVTDDGPGILPDVLPHIFEKFARGHRHPDETAGDGNEGTGLGLAIAKGIIETHGGTIRAESPVAGGRGARIEMRLPLREEPTA